MNFRVCTPQPIQYPSFCCSQSQREKERLHIGMTFDSTFNLSLVSSVALLKTSTFI
jgi:hypothetical protein